ncbi:MAG: hypothetical protein AAF500_16495 [Myxococcota bacterium]
MAHKYSATYGGSADESWRAAAGCRSRNITAFAQPAYRLGQRRFDPWILSLSRVSRDLDRHVEPDRNTRAAVEATVGVACVRPEFEVGSFNRVSIVAPNEYLLPTDRVRG